MELVKEKIEDYNTMQGKIMNIERPILESQIQALYNAFVASINEQLRYILITFINYLSGVNYNKKNKAKILKKALKQGIINKHQYTIDSNDHIGLIKLPRLSKDEFF